jgi:hypothetical protein
MMPDVNALLYGFFYSKQSSIGNEPASLRIETSVLPTALAFGGAIADGRAYAIPTAIARHSGDGSAVSAVAENSVCIRLTAEIASETEILDGFGDTDGDNDAGITLSFGLNDWVLNAGRYELSLQHGLEFLNVTADFFEAGQPVLVMWEKDGVNHIKAQAPYEPDSRFAGTVTLHRVI